MSIGSFCRGAMAAAAMSVALAGASEAQGGAGTSVHVFAGAAIPTGDESNVYGTGFHIGGGFQFQPALMPFGLRIDGGYTQHPVRNFPNDANVWTITGNAVMNLAADNPVYLVGGLGFYSTSIAGSSVDSETKTGFNLGAGFRLPLAGFGTFIEARYHHLFDARYRVVPIVFGITF